MLACRFWLTFRSEEHTSELQSLRHLVCRLLLEKKNWRGSRTICVRSASAYMCCAMICGYSPRTSVKTRRPTPPAWVMAFDLSHFFILLRADPTSSVFPSQDCLVY